MTVQEAIAAAEQILPGHAAPDGVEDPRWQAIIEISHFAPQESEAVWPFVLRWVRTKMKTLEQQSQLACLNTYWNITLT
jgi:hypothetical protein